MDEQAEEHGASAKGFGQGTVAQPYHPRRCSSSPTRGVLFVAAATTRQMYVCVLVCWRAGVLACWCAGVLVC